MKTCFFLILGIILLSCTEEKDTPAPGNENTSAASRITEPGFQSILDSAGVTGAVLIYDLQNGTYHSNDFARAEKGQLPASTFKIPHSLIALETGVVRDDSTLFEWDGEERALENWEQDLILNEAFHYSCVPCYQEVAREIGTERMERQLGQLNYGTMVFDSTTIDMFWLQGDSRISPLEQIHFLKRFYQSKLSVSERTEKIMKRMMVMEDNNEYTLRGKTGWSIEGEKNNGWFVGYIETDGKVYFFATNVEPREEFDMDKFPKIRKDVTFAALEQIIDGALNILVVP